MKGTTGRKKRNCAIRKVRFLPNQRFTYNGLKTTRTVDFMKKPAFFRKPAREFSGFPNKLNDDPQGGWTFIETLIVISIVLILTSSVGFMAVKYLDRAKVVTARSQIETFNLALEAYFFDCGRYPSDIQGLSALWEKPSAGPAPDLWNGPYINKPLPKDPWGNDYEYLIPGFYEMPYGVRSFGGDGQEGGSGNDADICSWG